jgi:photosystem II stability/assembly factor-like uncharacterized protein
MMRKYLVLLLLLCICVSIMSAPSFAAYPDTEVEFKEMLVNMGVRTTNNGGRPADLQKYKKYNLIV